MLFNHIAPCKTHSMKLLFAIAAILFFYSPVLAQVNLTTQANATESDSIYFKDGKAAGGKLALVEICAEEMDKNPEAGIVVDSRKACSCMYETVGKHYTYKQYIESLGKEGKDVFTKASKKDSPAYSEMIQCVVANMKGAGKKSGHNDKESIPAPESASNYDKGFEKSFLESCEKSAKDNKKMKKSGMDAVVYCRCTLDKIIERNLPLDKLKDLGNTESPLFTEIIVPCVTEALGGGK